MRDLGILSQKGKGRATYYIPDRVFKSTQINLETLADSQIAAAITPVFSEITPVDALITPVVSEITPVDALITPVVSDITPVDALITPVVSDITPVDALITPVDALITPVVDLVQQLPDEIIEKLHRIGKRINNRAEVEKIIYAICRLRPMKIAEIAYLIGRDEKYLLRTFITPMRESGKLRYTIPYLPNHPAQAYKTVENKK